MAKSQNVSDNGMTGKIEANKYRTQADGTNDDKYREEQDIKRAMAKAGQTLPFQEFNHGNVQ